MKLIKLSDTYYVIVDDSEIKKNDYFLWKDEIHKFHSNLGYGIKTWADYNKKDDSSLIVNWGNYRGSITHSTQPLENRINNSVNGTYSPEYLRFDNIKQLSLSKVEELIYGFDLNKMAEEYSDNNWDAQPIAYWGDLLDGPRANEIKTYKDGFKAHQELVKDKLFSINDITAAIQFGKDIRSETSSIKDFCGSPYIDYEDSTLETNAYIQSLLPKTEWDIEIIEGKIVLI